MSYVSVSSNPYVEVFQIKQVIIMSTNCKNGFLKLYEQIKKSEIDLDTLDPDTIHKLLLFAEEEYKIRKEYNDKRINTLLCQLQRLKKSLNNI